VKFHFGIELPKPSGRIEMGLDRFDQLIRDDPIKIDSLPDFGGNKGDSKRTAARSAKMP
jgi:hypothetical protein